MGTLLDLASLVVVPSGYKEDIIYSVKPTDGTGDLDFTRSLDTATRVGSDGLIEKVRTNLLIQSNGFNTASWTKVGLTITGGQADPNGGNTAFLATATATSSSYFFQANATAGCVSVFAKAGTRSKFSIINGLFAQGAEFDLAAQTTIVSGAGSLAKIEAVGGGWFRCSVFLSSVSDVIIALDEVFGGGVTIGQTMSFAFAQQETGDIATPYIPTTTAAVSVGMLANVPRLDYLGGGCPKLLLEPQRTNLLTFSEQINNAGWTKLQASITANTQVSPEGFTNADTLLADGTDNEHQLRSTGVFSVTSGQTFTTSIFVKAGTNNFVQFVGSGAIYSSTTYANFNVATGVVGDVGAGTTASIVDYGNDWYRCSMTAAATASSSTNTFLFNIVTSNTAIRGEINTLNTSVHIFGAQVEAGSYATSYIPTLGAAVTRSADSASKTGISALIGQTEGTLFVEVNVTSGFDGDNLFITLSDGTANNFILINRGIGRAEYHIMQGGVQQAFFVMPSVLSAGVHKLAIAYSANDFAFFLDGVLVHTDNSGTVPATSVINLGAYVTGGLILNGGINQALLFPTRLTNTQLIELTTP